MFDTIVIILSLAAAIVSAGAAVYAVWQVSRLRRSDEWRAVLSDIAKANNAANLLEQRVGAIEGDLSKLPTNADIARVEGAIRAVRGEVHDAKNGVDRIEKLLMERALGPGNRV